jgi:benzodiazapine receptor
MGYASYLVYRDGNGFDGAARWPLTVYGASLALNFVWTPIFFGAHNLGLVRARATYLYEYALQATVTACALSAVCGECVRQFRDINVTAGWLMVPTTLWCTFASFLTYNLYTMNRKSNK